VASYLYYRHDLSMMSDPEFDDICQRAAKNRGRLDPLRQFMLGSPGEIRASGFHVKVTVFAESAAYEWMRQNREKPNARQGRHHRVAIRRNTSTSLGRSLCSMRHIVWPSHCSNCGTKMGYVADSCRRPALYCLSCEPTEDEDEDRC
jgi:hypothetical protein